MTGKYDSDALICILAALPEGVTEFMSHPGFCGPELQAADTRLKASREQELRALTDPRVRQALSENGIRADALPRPDAGAQAGVTADS